MSLFRIKILLALLIIPLSLTGQNSSIPNSFRHFNTEQGLSHNWVYCFLEDELGFIWIGTRNGLNRFDGYDFQNGL